MLNPHSMHASHAFHALMLIFRPLVGCGPQCSAAPVTKAMSLMWHLLQYTSTSLQPDEKLKLTLKMKSFKMNTDLLLCIHSSSLRVRAHLFKMGSGTNDSGARRTTRRRKRIQDKWNKMIVNQWKTISYLLCAIFLWQRLICCNCFHLILPV